MTYPPLTAYRITYQDGSTTSTSMAAGVTLDDARAYFVGQWFNFGDVEGQDVMKQAISVEAIPDREKLASIAFWGGNEPLADFIRNKNSYEMDGYRYPANSLSQADYKDTVAAMSADELKPFEAIP